MAYPPSVPVGTRINTTPQVNTHAADHNTIHAALTDIITELGSNPSGDFADVTAHFAVVCPLGAILPYAGATAPTGWALCDGSTVSRATYADLFALIGTTYNTGGEAGTDFRLPDLRSRFITGKGTAAWSDALNESGGSKDAVAVAHIHTTPDHVHTTADHDHDTSDHYHAFGTSENGEHGHNIGDGTQMWYQGAAGGYGGWTAGVGNAQITGGWNGYGYSGGYNPYAAGRHSHTGNTGWASDGNRTGGARFGAGNTTNGASDGTGNTTNSQTPTASGTNANLPPYLTLNHIIRLT